MRVLLLTVSRCICFVWKTLVIPFVSHQDDMLIRVFNYNTLGRVHMFEAHHDYIRCIAVHPTQPYILTCSGKEVLHAAHTHTMFFTSALLTVSHYFFYVFSDDMLIKLWDWDQKWSCTQVFEGHTHYVMEVVFNPKDNNQFASSSLDRTLKVGYMDNLVQMFKTRKNIVSGSK